MPDDKKRRYLSFDQFRPLAGVPKEHLGEDLVLLMPRIAEIKATDEANRIIEFQISLPTIDRDQDSVALEGWDFTNYRKNPVVLWAHDHYSLPIGRAIDVRVEGTAVMSRAEFTPEDLNPFGFMCFRMYLARFLNAVSVGFQPKEWTYADDRKWGVNYIKQELLEYSGCPVPMHPDALAVARSKGIDVAPMYSWAERMLDEAKAGPGKLSDDARARLEVLRTATAPSGRALILELGAFVKAETPAPAAAVVETPGVETITRFKCSRGHEHDTSADAVDCGQVKARLEAQRDDLRKMLEAHVDKTGRVLSTANETRIRSAVTALEEVLSQLETAAEVEDDGTIVEEALEDGVVLRLAPDEPEPEVELALLALEETEAETEDGLVFNMSEAELAAAVSSSISDAIASAVRSITGRVD